MLLNYTRGSRKTANKKNDITSLLLTLDQFIDIFQETMRKIKRKQLLHNGHCLHKRKLM